MFTVSPESFAVAVGKAISLLVLAHSVGYAVLYWTGHGRLHGLIPLFNLSTEQNIPTLFSTLLILLNAFLCFVIWRTEGAVGPPERMWLVLSVALCLVGIDEFCMLHERLGDPIRNALHTTGPLYFAWVIPYGILAALLGLACIPFLWRQSSVIRFWLIGSGVVYVLGAVGMEMAAADLYASTLDKTAPLWPLFTTLEETLEMVGMAVCTYTLLRVLGERRSAMAVISADGESISLAPQEHASAAIRPLVRSA